MTPVVAFDRHQPLVLLAAGRGEVPADQQPVARLGQRGDRAVGGGGLEPGHRSAGVDVEQGQVAGADPVDRGEAAGDVDRVGDRTLHDVLDVTVQDRVERPQRPRRGVEGGDLGAVGRHATLGGEVGERAADHDRVPHLDDALHVAVVDCRREGRGDRGGDLPVPRGARRGRLRGGGSHQRRDRRRQDQQPGNTTLHERSPVSHHLGQQGWAQWEVGKWAALPPMTPETSNAHPGRVRVISRPPWFQTFVRRTAYGAGALREPVRFQASRPPAGWPIQKLCYVYFCPVFGA